MINVAYLNDSEVEKFVDSLDKNSDGTIDYAELEQKLDEVHEEIAPKPQPHHLHHDGRDREARHHFLQSIIGSDKKAIPRAEFADSVRTWNVPSMEQEKQDEQAQRAYLKKRRLFRRFRSYWAVHGPEIVFLALVISLQLAFGIWQLVKYLTQSEYRRALGWGVVLAKTCAGALYPTFFFVLISMSRYFSTALRRSYYISRFINWDYSQ
ncbi:hypothetical protein LTS18_011864, partial [Coniosporium uncinatum]